MILAGGRVYEAAEQSRILENLDEKITRTLSGEPLDRERVISVLDKMSEGLLKGDYRSVTEGAGISHEQVRAAAAMMSRRAIEFRLRQEVGQWEYTLSPPGGVKEVKVRLCPLGAVFHIAAGNAQGLPFLSVLEGLVTGNVNILKLPRADDGLTVELFRRLIEAEPSIGDYVYIFDTPSADISAMEKMAQAADGIVIYGGDEAVKAVRRLAPAGTRLIEWGHKLGFAYVSGYECRERDLGGLARHIISTGQRLCSSCQTIYINTDDMAELERFCDDFLPYLESEAEKASHDIGETAAGTLLGYTEYLEAAMGDQTGKVFRGKNFRLIISPASRLELSPSGGCLVKPLCEDNIIAALRPSKGYLQTAGLICTKESRDRLTGRLLRAGVCRVMRAEDMSEDIPGGCHDGEYGLRRLLRVTDTEESEFALL